jgi:imidazolonepropionase-like amidohydrolase
VLRVPGRALTRLAVVDMHSHLGVYSAPALSGASDGNSRHGPVLPWMRSVDGLNTHDDAYALSVAGGITSALVLPGSANAIGTWPPPAPRPSC